MSKVIEIQTPNGKSKISAETYTRMMISKHSYSDNNKINIPTIQEIINEYETKFSHLYDD